MLEQLEGKTTETEIEEAPPVEDAESPSEQEEEDPKALLEQARAEKAELQIQLEREQKARRDQYIAGLTAKQRDERQQRIETLLKDVLAKVSGGDMTTEAAQTAMREGLNKVEDEVADTGQTETLREEIHGIYTEIQAGLDDLPDSADKRDAMARWNEAQQRWGAGKHSEARLLAGHAKTSFDLAKERATPRRTAASMSLNVDAGGRPGNESDQVWLDRYADEENGGIPMTAANTKRASELQAKGLNPRVRKT